MAASSKTAQRILDIMKSLGGDPKETECNKIGILAFEGFGGCKFTMTERDAAAETDQELRDKVTLLARLGTGDDNIGVDPEEAPLEDKKVRKKKAKAVEKALDIAGSDDEHKTAVLEDME